MLLHQIIATNDKGTSSINTKILHPYKKSLYTYYKDLFCCEPVLMVTDVFNAVQYAVIVPVNEFSEAIDVYINACSLTDEDKMNQTELISFQSIMLKNF